MDQVECNAIVNRKLRDFGHGCVAILAFCAASVIVTFSIPIYLFRLVVIYLAKVVRPDLADCLCAASSFFATDLSSGKSPTCSTVLPITINGNLSKGELQEIVQRNWIEALEDNGKDFKYPQFRQYVCWWLGFPFWKPDPNFHVGNHVHSYAELASKTAGDIVSEQELDRFVETTMNARYPEERSPWDLYIVENYRNDKFPGATRSVLSVIVMRVQHSMVDGFSLLDAIVGGLFEIDLKDLNLPQMNHPRRTLWQQLMRCATLPFSGAYELTLFFSNFLKECPWRAGDSEKKWHHRYAKSELISIEQIKHTKNVLDVTFTSVLLSAISAGIYRTLDAQRKSKTLRKEKIDDHMVCMTALPLPETPASKIRRLKNHVTGLIFNIPCDKFPTALDRLRKCDEILEACKKSVVPIVTVGYIKAVGWLTKNWIYRIGKNRLVSTGLTTFPTKPKTDKFGGIAGREILFAEFATGTLIGDAGVGFMVISFYPYIRLAVTAEDAVMSREELNALVKYIEEEFRLLFSIANTIKPCLPE